MREPSQLTPRCWSATRNRRLAHSFVENAMVWLHSGGGNPSTRVHRKQVKIYYLDKRGRGRDWAAEQVGEGGVRACMV